MAHTSRRNWLKNSLLASSAMLVAPSSIMSINKLAYRESNANGDFMRLNWNENPYGPSDSALKAIHNYVNSSNHYGDDQLDQLKSNLASRYSLKNENILITSGSTEVLSLVGQHAGLIGGEIVTPSPSFPTLMMFGEACGATIKSVPLNDQLQIDLSRTLDAISEKTSVVFICNPNNPTSTEIDPTQLKSFCKSVPEEVLICVDEAYIQFSRHGEISSVINLISELPNLIVCRTFSKAYGLAGLRIGYALSHEANIEQLRLRYLGLEFCTNILGAVAALACLEDTAFINKVITKNEQGRSIVYKAFDQWGVKYAASATNFVYTRSERFRSDVVNQLSANDNIRITKWPTMTDHIRISIGQPEEMEIFVEAISKYRL